MRRVLATVVLVLTAAVGLPAASYAGGPTSVLVTHVGAGGRCPLLRRRGVRRPGGLLPAVETRGKAMPPGGGESTTT